MIVSLSTISILTSLVAGFAVPDGLTLDDTVKMAGDVEFIGVIVPPDGEAVIGGTLELDLYFKTDKPLDDPIFSFLHVESLVTKCRFVMDRKPSAPVNGIIKHHIEIGVPSDGDCADPQRLEIYTGLYNKEMGDRVEVLDPPAMGERIYAGFINLVKGPPPTKAAKSPATTPVKVTRRPTKKTSRRARGLSPSDMRGQEFWSKFRPWWGFLAGIFVALLLSLAVRWILKRQDRPLQHAGVWTPDEKHKRWKKLGIAAIVLVPLLASIFAALDFIKDDAYITFRYAQQFVDGNGLVFNAGDRLEGITTFSWTLLMIPFEFLGLDLFQVTEVLGTVLAMALAFYMVKTHILINGATKDLSHLWGAVWIAASSSFTLWATSGMEQPLAMFAPVAAAFILWRQWNEPDSETKHKGALLSGILMGIGCMTRPEVHVIGILLGTPLIIRAIKNRKIDRLTRRWFAGLLMITVPAHAFRILYYGNLFPNTFYVKTGDSVLVMEAGLKKLREMFDFNGLGVLVVLAPFAFLDKRRMTEKIVMVLVTLCFMGFVVKVGVDEMRWHRLFLPGLPFLVMLAALGFQNIFRAILQLIRSESPAPRYLAFATGWIALLVAVGVNFSFTYTSMGGFNGRGGLSGEFHPDLGKFITRHDQPGALAAFQDMGSTPYHAPDIKWLDFIGLVDGTVARARYNYGLHAFITTEAVKNKPKFDRDMREYFHKRNPEWAVLTSYVSDGASQRTWERFQKNPVASSIGAPLRTNGYQFGIYNKMFEEKYVHVRTWPRSRGYYLSLFRRRDLWEQVPGEVVLDAPPADMGGVTAKFEGGLELIGSHVDTPVTRKHEFFLTTWWRLPGPMDEDIYFFTHLEKEGVRHPFDSKPGDSMWPADRWVKGQILEHRTLVQLPAHIKTGDYTVNFGVYNHKDNTRLRVLEGPTDDQNRINLGPLVIESLIPPFDHLIKPTDIEEQRKYPERIIKHGRALED